MWSKLGISLLRRRSELVTKRSSPMNVCLNEQPLPFANCIEWSHQFLLYAGNHSLSDVVLWLYWMIQSAFLWRRDRLRDELRAWGSAQEARLWPRLIAVKAKWLKAAKSSKLRSKCFSFPFRNLSSPLRNSAVGVSAWMGDRHGNADWIIQHNWRAEVAAHFSRRSWGRIVSWRAQSVCAWG